MASNLVLHMGFINTPYSVEAISRPRTASKEESARKRRRSFRKTKTAEDVAKILEDKYGIVDAFQQKHQSEIDEAVKHRFEEVASTIASGDRKYTRAKLTNIMKPVTKNVEKLFRDFLDKEEMNGIVSGVPTAAALHGERHGRGSKTKYGIPRPSFIDTGIYRASFRCRVDTK